MNSLWSPELEFVARLSRVAPTAADDARVRELVSPALRWDRVLQLSRHHGVLALVERSLSRLQLPTAPAAFLAELRRERLSATSADLLRYGCWLELCRAFADEGLPVITLKGFHAVFAFYGEVGLRSVGDLDLLVRPEHVEAAIALLQRHGYEVTDEWAAARRNVGAEYLLKRMREMTLRSAEGVVVDLHWGAGRAGTTPSTDAIFASAEWLRVGGQDVLVPSRAVFVGLLLAHGHVSQWSRLRWVVDVAEGLDAMSPEDFGRVTRQLDAVGVSDALPSALRLMESLWGRIPAVAAQSERRIGDAMSAHHRRVLERERDSTRLEHHLGPLKALLDLARRTSSPVRSLLSATKPTARDWAVLRLPFALRWGYYLVRPYRVLRALVVRRPVAATRQDVLAEGPALTFVTAIFNNGPTSELGGRGRGIDAYLPSLINIGRIGAPIVVYCPAADVERIDESLAPHFARYTVLASDLQEFPLFDELMASKRAYIDTLDVNDRNEALCLMKSYWLTRTADLNPFEHEHFYWIDAGLTHHGIFPERVGGVELQKSHDDARYFPRNRANIFRPALGEALLAATRPATVFFCASPLHERLTDQWTRYARIAERECGRPANSLTLANHLVGGLFGGHRRDIHALHARYAQVLHAFIADRVFTLEEQVFSTVYALHADDFALQQFGTWWFYSPGESTSYLTTDGDSFYKVFTRLLSGESK